MRIFLAFIVLVMAIPHSVSGQTTKQEPMNLKALTPNLVVDDVNKTIKFYQETIGFETVQTVPDSGTFDVAMLKLDEVTIMFQSMKGFVTVLPEYKGRTAGGILLLYIAVENLDKIYKKVKEANA